LPPGAQAVTAAGEQAFCFEGYTLDLKRGCLRAADREIELRPKSFELLRKARAAAKAGLALDPNFTIRRWRALPFRGNPKFRAASKRIIEGMRTAGVPEG